MRLELGRRADYAVRAVVDLARHHPGGGRRKAREIASEMAIPRTFAPQILAELVRVELVTSVAGPGGGYALARAPADITLLDVVRAVDGEPRSTACVLRGGPCRWEGVCAVHVPWTRAQDALRAELDRTTFAELAAADEALEAGTDPAAADLRPDGDG